MNNQPQCSSLDCSVVERVVEGRLGEEDDVQSVVVRVRGDKSNTNVDDGNAYIFGEKTTIEFLSHEISDRNKQQTHMHETKHERVQVLQFVCPCLSKVSQKTSVHCTRVIAMGLGHSPVDSRMKQINNCTDQYNPGCGHLQRVYRPAGRPHVHTCLHRAISAFLLSQFLLSISASASENLF